MFTQCPKCQSVFMVSDKDIKAHEGLVRCGNCYSVFNSSWNLTDDPRSDFVADPVSPEELNASDSDGNSFTFNLMGHNTAASESSRNDTEPKDEEADGLEHQQAAAENIEQHVEELEPFPDHDHEALEPFPEPGVDDDFHTITPEAGASEESEEIDESEENLLYFDTGDESEEVTELVVEEDVESVETDDADILQDDSIAGEIPSLQRDDLLLHEDSDTVPGSLTEDSFWPGAEASIESGEDDVDLSVPDLGSADAGMDDADDNSSMLTDFSIDEDLLNDQFKDEPLLDAGPSSEEADNEEAKDELALPEILATEDDTEEVSVLDALVTDEGSADDFLLNGSELERSETGSLEIEGSEFDVSELNGLDHDGEELDGTALEIAELLQAREDGTNNGLTSGNAELPGQAEQEDDELSLEALSAAMDEGPDLGDEEGDSTDESVFITSDDEDVDETYVAITMKEDGSKASHDEDEFPEPGEISELNFEGTMELDAMIEAAHISKDHIDTALSEKAAEEASEESLIAADDVFSDVSEDSNEEQPPSRGMQSLVSGIKNLLRLPKRSKADSDDVGFLGEDETKLKQHLHSSQGSFALPEGVSKFLTISLSVLLTASLLGQIGYFYMDKLVAITPLKPGLVVACKVAGCTVPGVQNLDEIEQLQSRMDAMPGDDKVFKVSSVLVNRGINPQAFPALELTVTDRAGNVISRRVVRRDEYLNQESAAMMNPNEAVDISIRFSSPSVRVDGFELRPVSQNWLERTK